MELKIYTKNLELNAETEKHIQKKFDRLQRHLRSITDAKLEVSRTSARAQNKRILAQMTLTTNGYTLRGQESGLNLLAAIDAVTDVLDRQIQTYKGKVYRSAQAKKAARGGAAQALEETIVEQGPQLGRAVRTKRFRMKPTTVEDAILEMELLSHDFFLFYNVETDEYNVAYRRHDGEYGVIEPELA